jgi:hypothetical protein
LKEAVPINYKLGGFLAFDTWSNMNATLLIVIIVILVCIAVLAFLLLKRRSRKSRKDDIYPEMGSSPQMSHPPDLPSPTVSSSNKKSNTWIGRDSRGRDKREEEERRAYERHEEERRRREAEAELKARRESLRKKYRISITHPKLLSKRYSSRFLVQIYLPEMRAEVARTLAREFEKQEIAELVRDSEFETGQRIKLMLSSPGIVFSEPVTKKLDKGINTTNFTAKPDDSCHPGIHQVILSLSDTKTQFEYQSISFTVKVTDFAFDHVSRPFISNLTSIALGTGSLIMFVLTLLGQIDTKFGLTSGTVAGTLASAIYVRFLQLYQQPKITNAP